LQKLSENKLQEIRQPSTITAYKAVNSQALLSYIPSEKTLIVQEIEKAVAKLFYALGHTIEVKRIEIITELLTESRKHETPETILLFLHKCAKGEMGKFYGLPGIDQLQEKFSDFLQFTIIPAREQAKREGKEIFDNQREQQKSLREIIQGAKTRT
jgi:hypothetical protein